MPVVSGVKARVQEYRSCGRNSNSDDEYSGTSGIVLIEKLWILSLVVTRSIQK